MDFRVRALNVDRFMGLLHLSSCLLFHSVTNVSKSGARAVTLARDPCWPARRSMQYEFLVWFWVPLFEFLYLSWVPLKIPLNELITFIISFMSLFLNLKVFTTCIYACAQKLFCWTFAPFLANFDILHSNNFFPILRAGKMRGKGKNPGNCTILDSWVSDNFILANFNIKIYEALKIFYQLIIYVENYSCP